MLDDPEFQEWVTPLVSRLIPILHHCRVPRSFRENAAVSLGRLGLMHPVIVAPRLTQFAQVWCEVLCETRDSREKDSAFLGLCAMIQLNPTGIASIFLSQSRFLLIVITESTLVLQLDCSLEPAISRIEQHVQDVIGGLQTT